MLLRSVLLLLAVTVCASAVPAAAAPASSLYQATVPVTDQKPETRERALREALGLVLIRVTGDRFVGSGSAAHELLPRAAELALAQGVENAPGGGLQLRAVFDARAVDAAVRQLGLPLWGASRPSHLLWVALRDTGPRTVLDRNAATRHASALLEVADLRGLPLSFPDPQGGQPGFEAVWNGDYAQLQAASAPYRTDRIVVVRAGRAGGSWVARWALLGAAGPAEEWSSPGQTLDEALAEGLHRLADREAAQFAVRSGGYVQDVRVEVADVRSVADYARALAYLRGLSVVRAVAVDRLREDVVSFRLRVDGEPALLARIIGSGAVLRRGADFDADGRLIYVLAR